MVAFFVELGDCIALGYNLVILPKIPIPILNLVQHIFPFFISNYCQSRLKRDYQLARWLRPTSLPYCAIYRQVLRKEFLDC